MSELAYVSIDSCRAHWRAANCKIVNVPADAETLSVNVQEIEDLALLLEKDAGWTQDDRSVDPHLFQTWGQYRGELPALKSSVLRRPLEVVMIRGELLPSNIAL